MYVYFIQQFESRHSRNRKTREWNKRFSKPSHIKIGKAIDVDERLKVLQTGNPHELRVICTVPCKSEANALAMEEFFHHFFRSHRVRGEWFDRDICIKKAVDRVNAEMIDAEGGEGDLVLNSLNKAQHEQTMSKFSEAAQA